MDYEDQNRNQSQYSHNYTTNTKKIQLNTNTNTNTNTYLLAERSPVPAFEGRSARSPTDEAVSNSVKRDT